MRRARRDTANGTRHSLVMLCDVRQKGAQPRPVDNHRLWSRHSRGRAIRTASGSDEFPNFGSRLLWGLTVKQENLALVDRFADLSLKRAVTELKKTSPAHDSRTTASLGSTSSQASTPVRLLLVHVTFSIRTKHIFE